jgi:nucleoside triphosphate pyrophosphatase
MRERLILASTSDIRLQMLSGAGVVCTVAAAKIDEAALRASMVSACPGADQVAEALAQAKAEQVSREHPRALVIGCDQVLVHDGEILGKAANRAEAAVQLRRLIGQRHQLVSAVAVFKDGKPLWGHIGTATMHMRNPSPEYLADYIGRNWHSIRHSVGCYKLEEEGARLFSRVQGDYFTVLGLPLVELLGYLTDRGVLQG